MKNKYLNVSEFVILTVNLCMPFINNNELEMTCHLNCYSN